jgi:inorganic triphosphatase YgiF
VRLTLKQLASDESGVLRREELEALVAVDVPPAEWPAGELRDRVRGIAGKQPLEPFLGLAQERLTRRVLDGDREVAELSLDHVMLDGSVGDAWYELELELRGDGDEVDLDRLIAALSDVVPLAPEPRSKFARALEAAAPMGGGRACHMGSLLAGGARPARAGGAQIRHPARRALALLALDEGLTQLEAGRRAGLSDRRVRYWLARYRSEGVAIYGLSTPDVDLSRAIREARAARPMRRRRAVLQPSRRRTRSGPGSSPKTLRVGQPMRRCPRRGRCCWWRTRRSPCGRRAGTAGAHAAGRTAGTAGAGQEASGHRRRRHDDGRGGQHLRFHLEKMLEHEEGTRRDEDIEELHDMRVSTRRMRMALRVFADYLDRDTMRPVLKGLRRTGATLGAVRDLDVFHAKTQHYLASLPPELGDELDGLMKAWKSERERQVENLVAYLDGDRYRRFVETTMELLDASTDKLAPQTTGGPRPQRVSQVLPGILYRTWGRCGRSKARSEAWRRRSSRFTRFARPARVCGTRSSSSRECSARAPSR